MENASKALLMAGGVLIAVLIISLFVYMFTSASSMFQTEEDVERIQEIEEYNKQYESYNRNLLRGTDLISLMNKVISNNAKYEDEGTETIEEYRVTIKFKLKEDLAIYEYEPYYDENGIKKYRAKITNKGEYLKAGKEYSVYKQGDSAYTALSNNQGDSINNESFNDFKRRVFDCTGVHYNEYGRVDTLIFKERKIDYEEGF